MRNALLALIVGVLVWNTVAGRAADIPVSEATAECLDCHAATHPGIVQDWQNSRHAAITPNQALAADGLARKVSSKTVPDNLQNISVGCAECHTLRPGAHADTFEHNGYDIHLVVSPKDCATCHSSEAEQYSTLWLMHTITWTPTSCIINCSSASTAAKNSKMAT